MNRLLVIFPMLCALLIATAPPTWADSVSVPATADSVVHANSPDAISNNTTDLVATKFGDAGQPSTDLKFFFMQFQLPGGLTGQDMAAVNDAQLELTRSVAANFRLNFNIYGVLDGVDSASVDTYSWNSGVGYFPANNLVKFLSADEISYYSDPAESVVVGNIRTANDEGPNAAPNPPISVNGPFDFTIEANSPSAIANLKDLILNDTDGRLTFFASVRQPFELAASNTIASVEHDTFAPPTLVIDFTRVPEPSSLLIAVGAAAWAARRRMI